MKKAVLTFITLAIGIMLLCAACAKNAEVVETTPEIIETETETISWAERFSTENAERVVVGIAVGEEGFYSFWADAEVTRFDDEITEMVLTDPTLLAFCHSENWDGGYYMYDYTVIQDLITVLRQYDDPQLQAIADELERGLLMTEAAT